MSNMTKFVVSFQDHFYNIFKVFIMFGRIQPILIALICWVIVIIGSWANDFHRPPDFYLSDKRNVFNVFFAKWCLAWTLAFLTPYMVLIYWIKSKSNLKVVWKNVLRLVVAVAIWYVFTSILDWIENLTGECEGTDLYSRKQECVQEGLVWNGIDISGHSFMLTYCTLIISEEIQVVSFWTNKNIHSNKDVHDNILSSDVIHTHGRFRANQKFQSDLQQQALSVRYLYIVLYVACSFLMSLWVMLLALTSFYFHTVNSKVLGVTLGISAWLHTYQAFFCSKHFPGSSIRF